MKKIFLLSIVIMAMSAFCGFAKEKTLPITETEWGYEISLDPIEKEKADFKIAASNKPDGFFAVCDLFDFQEFANSYITVMDKEIPQLSRLINGQFQYVYSLEDVSKISCVFLKGKPIACSAVIKKKTICLIFDTTLNDVPIVKEYIKKPVKQSDEIVLKELGFDTIEEFRNWIGRVLSNRLYKSLINGVHVSFKKDDFTYMQRHLLQIRYMDVKPGPIYIYLVSTVGFNHCCEIHSEHQLSYLPNDLINEDMLLKYVGEGQYKQGFEVKDCDVFYLMEETSPDYIYFDKVMRSGLR